MLDADKLKLMWLFSLTSVDLSGADLSGARLSLVEGAPPVVVEGSRPPTLEECQSIIQHLQHTNEKQSHEVREQLQGV